MVVSHKLHLRQFTQQLFTAFDAQYAKERKIVIINGVNQHDVIQRQVARARLGRRAEIQARRLAVGAEAEQRERRLLSGLLLPVRGGPGTRPRSWLDLVPSRL